MEPLLQISHLTKNFSDGKEDEYKAVDDVSFELFPGEKLAIIGESGSGKTTVVNMITRLLDSTDGKILLDGEDITHYKRNKMKNIYRKMQMVFQTPTESFDPRCRLGDAVAESLRNAGIPKKEAMEIVKELFKQCGLPENFMKRYPHEVSGGQCQRAAIARAIAIKPRLLILDEATSALDVTVQAEILQLLDALQEERQMSYLFICHDIALVQNFCDRVLVMPTKVPLLLSETIEKIMESEAPLCCPVYEGRRGHPVMIAADWIPKILNYQGEYGLRSFLREPEADVVLEEIPVDDRGIIQAVETDEDCAMAMSGNHGKLPLHSRMSLYLECDEVFFGPGIAQFLSLIDHTGSMQTACKQMHMSYSKGWKIMKTAERELGYPLLITQSGGAEGGFSQLTPKTKDFLNRFLQMEQEMNSHASRLFEKYFGDER